MSNLIDSLPASAGHDPASGTGQTAAEQSVARLIVTALQLETQPEAISPTERLFGEGLGLDSIDALELALAISRAHGFELRSDDERNRQIFALPAQPDTAYRGKQDTVAPLSMGACSPSDGLADTQDMVRPDSGHAVLVGRPQEAVLFHAAGQDVTAGAFLHDVHGLAARLPCCEYLLNLCQDRYAFAVAFTAAVLRGQVCVLSGDRSPAGFAALVGRFPGSSAAIDGPADTCDREPVWNQAQAAQVQAIPVSATPGSAPTPSLANPLVRAGQLAAIVFTSGTTGAPVAHPKHWGALVARSRAAGLCFGLDPAGPSAVVGTVPPQHMYGFETTVLLPLHAAASSWCGAAFYPGDIQAALAALPAPRILITTPLQLRALMRAGTRLPALQATISATAPLDAALAAEAEASWHTEVHEIFGATEVGSIASRRTTGGDTWTSYPGVALHSRTEDTLVQAPHAPPTPLADVVEPLAGSRFRVLGRRADLVKLGGRRASLSGLTRILAGLPGVLDGVFLAPDDLEQRPNARLLAVVVAPHRSADTILAELRGQMDPLFLPRRVIHVDQLPRNELGKLPRQALLAMLAQADAERDTLQASQVS